MDKSELKFTVEAMVQGDWRIVAYCWWRQQAERIAKGIEESEGVSTRVMEYPSK